MLKNRLIVRAAFATALLAGAAVPLGGAQAISLITNGSFEDTTSFSANGDGTMVLGVGSTAMPGWTVVSGGIAWIGPTNTFGLTASNGSYFLDLSDYRDAIPYGGVSQTSVATVANSQYRLSFDLGSSSLYGVQDAITVSAGATSQTFTTNNLGNEKNKWQSETLLFTATGASTLITLTGYSGFKYIGLDNVSLDLVESAPPLATPLPAALPLFATCLGAMGLLARRRKRKTASLAAA